MSGLAERGPQLSERGWIVVVAVDVPQQLHQTTKRVVVHSAPVFGEAAARALAQLFDRPARLGDTDDRDPERSVADHVLQRREDLFVGKITGRTEEDERVRPNLCVLGPARSG